MIYTDKVHFLSDSISDNIKEMHDFAEKIGLNKCWFENKKLKFHPHFDLTNKNKIPLIDKDGIKFIDKAIKAGAQLVSKRKIIEINDIRKRSSPICKSHKIASEHLGYVAWHEWADRKAKMGHVQKECRGCLRWFFKCEF